MLSHFDLSAQYVSNASPSKTRDTQASTRYIASMPVIPFGSPVGYSFQHGEQTYTLIRFDLHKRKKDGVLIRLAIWNAACRKCGDDFQQARQGPEFVRTCQKCRRAHVRRYTTTEPTAAPIAKPASREELESMGLLQTPAENVQGKQIDTRAPESQTHTSKAAQPAATPEPKAVFTDR